MVLPSCVTAGNICLLGCQIVVEMHALPSSPFLTKYAHFWLQKNEMTMTKMPNLCL